MNHAEYVRASHAVELAIARVLEKGTDDVFKPPVFSHSIESAILAIESKEFKKRAYHQGLKFLRAADLNVERIGPTRRCLVTKDQNTFRQAAWLDPFDTVKYLATTYLLFEKIEAARIPKHEGVIHSHRMSLDNREILDSDYGYDSFRARSSELSSQRIGKWKIVTDISNFFDRIGNHSLENHLLDVGCEKRYVTLIREMLLSWAGDRRSFGVPVGSDASRILSEAVLLNVDRTLKSRNIVFVRYVDDFRMFAETRAEALKSIEILTSLLAEEGLSLNSRKTDIFQIVSPEEIANSTNRFISSEHERIGRQQKREVRRGVQVSGRSSISRFYREPGQDTLKKILAKSKADIIAAFLNASETDIEQEIKLVVKYFIHADQDVTLLRILVERRITSIYYVADALVKEADRFDVDKCAEIKVAVFDSVDWLKCAYPYQVPILRISAHPSFTEPRFVCAIVDGHLLQMDSMLFYREAISLGYPCLDRARLRRLAIDVFESVPPFVGRAIYSAIKSHPTLPEDENGPC